MVRYFYRIHKVQITASTVKRDEGGVRYLLQQVGNDPDVLLFAIDAACAMLEEGNQPLLDNIIKVHEYLPIGAEMKEINVNNANSWYEP